MAWSDAGQRSEAMSIACTGCNFAVSNRPAVSTSATATCRCRYQSLTARGMIYGHVSSNYTRDGHAARLSEFCPGPGLCGGLSSYPDDSGDCLECPVYPDVCAPGAWRDVRRKSQR